MNNHLKYLSENYIRVAIATLSVFLVLTEPSFAQVDFAPIRQVLEGVATSLTGPLGVAIATLAVIAIGITFMMGKMDWMFAAAILFGIAIVFGAAFLANGFSGAAVA